ncbi:carboxypeptidase M32 [Clostridium sp. Marseille-P299]|uniref:carboxypeptidase M32 n=1 Tax=Clostridium sp. Marseille-P299 TaxID=1805477 RepID=UPI00083757B1|nr:carboxypeptidase M32 [Clostridium sp. Marseille-P299]
MNETFQKLQPYMDKITGLSTALTILNWDLETLAPKGGVDNTAKAMGSLSGELYGTIMNDDVRAILKELESETDLSEKEKGIVKIWSKEFQSLEKIPKDEYQEYSELTAKSGMIWQKAKAANDYSMFEPYLDKLIDFNKRFAGYRAKEGQKLYDVLLDDFEEGFTTEKLDEFFAKLKEEIVPLLKAVVVKNNMIDKSYNYRSFDTKKQDSFNRWIAAYLGFDFNKGVIAESEHPFTTELHNHDVRITTHYYENNLESAMFSTIHETGHALYEMGVSDELTQTLAGGGASMGMHESQSRFFENVIGRSEAFWRPIFGRLKATFFEELKDLSLDNFIKGINKVEPGLIRTEADELTYCLHIMVRYEIEKLIFEGKVTTKELPELWNAKYEEYLGIRPKTDAEGILQDTHWSGGSFGYFPSYALGNAIAAQLYAYMDKQMDIDEILRKGEVSKIVAFLREHIHQYGKLKKTDDFLMEIMNESFNPTYYVDYLKEKFTRIYEL